MKILHIITDLRKGGAERIASDIVRELNNRPGVTAMLVLLEGQMTYDVSDIADFVKVIPASVTLSVFRPTRYDLRALQEFVDTFRPDVIHTHLFIPDLVSHSLEYTEAKWFTHCHSNTKEIRKPTLIPLSKHELIDWWVYRYIVARYRKYNNNFIAISPTTYNYYAANLPDLKKNITLLPNAINVSAFSKYAVTTPPSGAIRLVSVGSLIERKNQLLQIEVAQVLRQRGMPFHLDIFGQGVMHDRLQSRIAELGLQECVTLRGVHHDVGAEMAQATLFLHTALHEPFGLVIVEALASGLPVIALDGGGNKELVKDAKNGYLIPQANAGLIADRILQASEPSQQEQMRQYALESSMTYDIFPYVTRLLELYQH